MSLLRGRRVHVRMLQDRLHSLARLRHNLPMPTLRLGQSAAVIFKGIVGHRSPSHCLARITHLRTGLQKTFTLRGVHMACWPAYRARRSSLSVAAKRDHGRRDRRVIPRRATSTNRQDISMGNLRTGNKRHNRATARAAKPAKTAPVAEIKSKKPTKSA
jgi:hypothetical protein